MLLRILASLASLFLYSILASSITYSISIPEFPTCENPQETLKVEYSQGTHGIVGETSTHTGSDAVYTVSDTTLIQCYCDENDSGIQTNWLLADTFSSEDIEILKRDGWFYVPNGSLWGLDDSLYVAKNSNYSCITQVGGTQVQSAMLTAPDILSLGSTGDEAMLYGMGSAVVGFVLLALYLFKKTREQSSRSKL